MVSKRKFQKIKRAAKEGLENEKGKLSKERNSSDGSTREY